MRHMLGYSCNLYTGFEDQFKMLNGGGLGLQCQFTHPLLNTFETTTREIFTARPAHALDYLLIRTAYLHGTAFC